MRVVVIGAGGVGSVLCKLLAKEKEIEKIFCCDIKFNYKINSRKVILKKLSILDKKEFLNFLLKTRPDVVVNVSLPKFNLSIMETCLKAKTNYIDTASFWDIDKRPKARIPYRMEQLSFDKKFAKSNITGLICAGVAPGMDNVLTAECASHLDEVDYIKIRMVEDTGSKEMFFSWNKDWLLDELGTKPLIYENGRFKLADSFGAEEEFKFPLPIGKRKTYYFAQDEVGSIPLYIKTKKMDVKIYDNNIEVSKLIVKLGLASDENINVDGAKIRPVRVLSRLLPNPVPGEERKYPESIFAIAVEAIGKSHRKKKTARYSIVFPKQKKIEKMNLGANFISYPTALSVKLFVMAFPKIRRKGVFPPEALEKEVRQEILKELEKYCKLSFKII